VGDGGQDATLGDTLRVARDGTLQISLRVRVPKVENANGDLPALKLVELIVGGKGSDGQLQMQSRHFAASDWQWTLPAPAQGGFVRARGNSTGERVALADIPGEDPWQDLWFHSNPVFVQVR